MSPINMESSIRNVNRVLNRACAKKCWHISAGGCTLPQFTMALGEKVRRKRPIRNPELPRDFREFEGEVSFFVRCWWRLECGGKVVVSSNDVERKILNGLSRLVGQSLVRTGAFKPAWDLVLEFSERWILRIFPNQPDGADDALKNWHARVQGKKIYAGPGAKLEIVT